MNRLFDMKSDESKESHYTQKIKAPQYVPSEINPSIAELYDYTKYASLLANINSSNVSEEEKNFLKLAATRHIVFNYSKVADYYASASPEMQELMEQSALVILDIDDAIANGYVKLSKTIKKIIQGEE